MCGGPAWMLIWQDEQANVCPAKSVARAHNQHLFTHGNGPKGPGCVCVGLCRFYGTLLGAHVPCPDRLQLEVDGGAHDQFLYFSSNHCKR